MMDVAREALPLQNERLRIGSDRLDARMITASIHDEPVLAQKKAEYEELQADVGYCLAVAELDRVVGVCTVDAHR